MQNHSLGPPIETYGPNIRIAILLSLAGIFFCLMAFGVAHETKDATAWSFFYAFFFFFSGTILWQLSFRAGVHEAGLSCRNIFLSKEMRWHEVERFYFGCHELHFHIIPLGTFYRLKIQSVHGQSISLSNHVRRAEDLAVYIAQFTLKPLTEKALQSFQSGNVLDFGAILVSPSEGVTLKKLFFDKTIPWREIESYDVNSSFFSFRLSHKFLPNWNTRSEKVANPHVLKSVLDSVMQIVWSAK